MRTTSQDDYLIRLIRQMVQTILRIAGLRQGGEFEEAQSVIDHATGMLLGPAADTLTLLDPATAAQVVGDPDRVIAWAGLLLEQARLHQVQGDLPAAENARERALALAREAVRRGVSDPDPAAALVEVLLQAGS